MPGLHGFGICNCAEESAQLGLTAKWLNPWIALDQATALNVDDGDIKTVLFKKYDERTMDDLGWVRTPPDDNELLAFIPFSSPVQVLQSIFVIGGEGGKHPRKVRLFANPPPACTEFSDFCDRTPEQEIDLAEDLCGAVEYPVRATKFSNLTMLVMHFQTDEAAEEKEIFWIGLKGTPTEWKRQAVITVYESQAQAADHEAPDDAFAANMMQH
mmetsp:Transcript_3315/g.7797  ORF Transcript_3315/g.7797 Transcript_3315/m.7797 type:complete len:213 (+) Transcript_3315:314-952(+)|eukprot:CAMPEP_0178996982 /NCGR_PEP_ID=MMETSP0795-20121207/8675_1 /TAXON_ID=88552 /ORGANISM="Amoebophrya sp., Strain Ameob2" /LENGTH=212 /DNA_ID=CAMNT_0020689441 /DNA_START=324 /DNA_END=962 /DNA_ORIENTATION=-